MAKLYYGDTNNTAVEINLDGGVSGDYLPLTGGTVTGNVTITGDVNTNTIKSNNYRESIKINDYNDDTIVEFNSTLVTFHYTPTAPSPTAANEVTNKQYVDSNFPLSPTIRNIQVVSALPSSPDASTLYLIQG